jgi:hypothetical protein
MDKGRSHQHKVIFKLGLDDVFPLLALSQGFRVIEIQLRANPGLVPIKEKKLTSVQLSVGENGP